MTTKMNFPGLLLFFAVVLFTIPSCDILGIRGTGELETEIRNVDNFHALEINVPGDVEVRTDSIFYVEVTCEGNLIAYLETVEDDGVLKIHFDRDVYDVADLKIRVNQRHPRHPCCYYSYEREARKSYSMREKIRPIPSIRVPKKSQKSI